MLYLERFSLLSEIMIAFEDPQLPRICEWTQSMLDYRKVVYKQVGMFNGEELLL